MKRLIFILAILVIGESAAGEWLHDSIINDRNNRCRTGYNGARNIVAEGSNIYAIWTEEWYNVFLRTKIDGVWRSSELVSVNSPGGIYGISAYPSIAVRNGELHIVWEDYRTGDFEIFYRKYSGGWYNVTNLSGDTANSRVPVITLTDAGNIFLVWQDDRTGIYEIYCKIYDGENWSAAEKISSTSFYAGFPTIAHLGETVYAVWEEMENNGYELYTSTYYGGNWSSPSRITQSEGMGQNPSISIDPSGILHLVWVDDVVGNFVVYYSRFDGINWSTPIPVTDNAGEALYPQITSDPFGIIHLVWSDNREGNYEIFHKTLVSGVWSEAENVSEKENLSTSPHITCTGDGAVHLLWYDCADDSIFTSPHILYRRYNPVIDRLSTSIEKEVMSGGIRISATLSKTELHLFRIDGTHPIPVPYSIEENRIVWFETLFSGEYTYILQSIDGVDVHYSKPIHIIIPEERDFFNLTISPNPFREKTVIRLTVNGSQFTDKNCQPSTVNNQLQIYNASGRMVKDFSLPIAYSLLPTVISWDGKDNKGEKVGSGIYFLKLKVKSEMLNAGNVRKIIKIE